MKEVITAGGIITESGKILLIRHKKGGLTFAKGHVEKNESLEDTARREVAEETSHRADIVGYLGFIERLSTEKSGEVVKKRIELFKMILIEKVDMLPEELPEWVHPREAIHGMRFPEEASFLEQHMDILE